MQTAGLPALTEGNKVQDVADDKDHHADDPLLEFPAQAVHMSRENQRNVVIGGKDLAVLNDARHGQKRCGNSRYSWDLLLWEINHGPLVMAQFHQILWEEEEQQELYHDTSR